MSTPVQLTKAQGKQLVKPVLVYLGEVPKFTNPEEVQAYFIKLHEVLNAHASDLAVLKAQMTKAASV